MPGGWGGGGGGGGGGGVADILAVRVCAAGKGIVIWSGIESSNHKKLV